MLAKCDCDGFGAVGYVHHFRVPPTLHQSVRRGLAYVDGWAQCPIVRTLELLVPKFAKCRIGAKYRRVKKCPLICILQDRGHFWLSAFKRLDHEIKDDALTVVLLDEISWMGRYDDLFADSIKIAWDNMWKKHDRLVLVLCGSVSSWIKEHIVDSAAFVGRRSCDLIVRELPLKECVKFWGREVERIDLKEIVAVC